MAEFVQRSIEEILPELEQMKRINLFTEKETKIILKKRQAFEYKLRRRTKLKEDYIQYIQYEINTLSLLRKRRNRTGCVFKQADIDFPIINRIHRLFQLVCRRFPSDVSLWLSHLNFFKQRKSDKVQVSHLFVKMLQVHNKNPDLWILAAKWEMEEALSMDNSRMLLQRGLRFNPTSQKLWLEYFRMELLNTDKLRQRQEVLGIDQEIIIAKGTTAAVLNGDVARLVFRKAIEHFTEQVDVYLQFLAVCSLFKFAKEIEEEIIDSMKLQCAENELVWEAVSLLHLRAVDNIKKTLPKGKKDELRWQCDLDCANAFYGAVQKINTEKMWTLFIKFCQGQLAKKARKKLCNKRAGLLLTVYEQAEKASKLSEEQYAHWFEVLGQLGEIDQMEDVLKRGFTHHPHSCALWRAKIEITLIKNQPRETVKATIQQALEKATEKESLGLWQMCLSWARQHNPQYANTLYERGIYLCPEVCIPLKVDYLHWTVFNDNLKHTRKLYKRLIGTQPLCKEFFQAYIDIEKAQAVLNMKKLRMAYEDYIRLYGSSHIDMWLDFIKLERSHSESRPEETGTIYWRAIKTLDGQLTEKFITMHTLLQNEKL